MKKIHGTTIFIGTMDVEMYFGKFTSYTFQDLIHKGYIIALCHGDINANILYTRMHSSCVTSETMRSLDCDCVSQLYGALKKISQNNGILFYLIQEGRGCGYVGKSRACMMVQYKENTDNEINTFQAYEELGMKHDYRSYTNVKDICTILDINPEFILLTNNPDKIEKFNSTGLKLKAVESIEIKPNPFNQQYLMSKESYGHILYQTKTKVTKYIIPYPKIEPFEPYNITNCQRFVHVSSYYLPIKPVDNNIILTDQEFFQLREEENKTFQYQMIDYPGNKIDGTCGRSYFVKISDNDILEKHKDILCKPYWFKVNVFYDIVTNTEYLVLEYGDCRDKNVTPVVRIHSESIFNRFPVKDPEYKHRYKKALEYIIRNGAGIIIILYNDGRGSGLGYYVLNNQNSTQTTIGVEEDRRDYFGACKLLEHFIDNNNCIDVLYGNSGKTREFLQHALNDNGIKVRDWINISKHSENNGHDSIYQRMSHLPDYMNTIITDLNKNYNEIKLQIKSFVESKSIKICVSGIGSSEAHAKFLVSILKHEYDITFVDSVAVTSDHYDKLILFSQGLSPNSNIPLSKFNYKNILLVTTVSESGFSKGLFSESKIEKIKKIRSDSSNVIINYEPEIPDDTLIRVSGTCGGYTVCLILAHVMKSVFIMNIDDIQMYDCSKIMNIMNNRPFANSEHVIKNIVQHKKLLIIADPLEKNYIANIKNKFTEGAFIDVIVSDSLEFAHGTYQFLEHNRHNGILFSVIIVHKNMSSISSKLYDMLFKTYPVCLINIMNDYCSIFELEIVTNSMIFQLIQLLRVDQKNWPGKNSQGDIYDLELC